MAMLRHGIVVGHALRRSGAAAASRFSGNGSAVSGTVVVGLAALRPPPPAAAASPFFSSARSFSSTDRSRRIEETKGELLKIYLQMHADESTEKVKLELCQLLRQFQAKTGSATAKRSSQSDPDPSTAKEKSLIEDKCLLDEVDSSKELGAVFFTIFLCVVGVWALL